MNMKNEIVRAEATYTGGGIYIYTGQLADGRFFQTADEWEECVMILDEDPQEHWDDENEDDNCTFETWQNAHTVEELTGKAALLFWRDMLWKVDDTDEYFDGYEHRMEYIEKELLKGDQK